MTRSSTRDGYGYRWQQASKRFLRGNPLCAHCDARGAVVAATVVDHINPHKGSDALFWDVSNWQPLCKRCHDLKTIFDDRGRKRPVPKPRIGVDGYPIVET